MSVDPRTPCLIGGAQRTVRPGEGPSPEPLALWDDVSRLAADDALPGAGARVLDAVDSLQIVYCMAWPYDAPVDRLADSLGIAPRHRLYSGIGGTTPQVLVQDAAAAILAGELRPRGHRRRRGAGDQAAGEEGRRAAALEPSRRVAAHRSRSRRRSTRRRSPTRCSRPG